MLPQGSLAPIFGPLIGVGPGAGLRLIFVIIGLLIAVIGLAGYAVQAVRNAEDILPDHDTLSQASHLPAL